VAISTLRQLVKISVGPRLAESGGLGVVLHPSVVRDAAPPHVFNIEQALDPRVHRFLIGVCVSLNRLVGAVDVCSTCYLLAHAKGLPLLAIS
jgi:hypothetical protein